MSVRGRSLRIRTLASLAAGLALSGTVAAEAQAPPSVASGPRLTPSPTPSASAIAPAATAASTAPPADAVHRRHRLAPLPGARTVRSANAAARSYPTAQGYINSTLFYDYEAGRLYEVQTSPHFLTAIMLRPGEKLLAKAAGDTVRWVMGETAQGSGPDQQVVVLLKPIRGGLRTNIVLTTNQRTYLIEAASREGGTYTSAVSWTYPQEAMQALAAAQAAAQAAQAQKAAVVVAPVLAIDQLHFGYKIAP